MLSVHSFGRHDNEAFNNISDRIIDKGNNDNNKDSDCDDDLDSNDDNDIFCYLLLKAAIYILTFQVEETNVIYPPEVSIPLRQLNRPYVISQVTSRQIGQEI